MLSALIMEKYGSQAGMLKGEGKNGNAVLIKWEVEKYSLSSMGKKAFYYLKSK